MSDASAFYVGPDDQPDRYEIGDAVGSGAEGILYRGSITTATGMVLAVAVKMLQPRYLGRLDDWQAAWGEQVELLRSLQVPGVVPVRDGFLGPLPHHRGEARNDAKSLYLVMNWVEGETLDEWVRRHRDSDPLGSLKLLLPVASALDLMHEGSATGGVPVVHRDVKPSNILVTSKGSVLVDFGLTRGLPGGSHVSVIAGTPGYIAPETLERGAYTPAVDRYAMGGVAYFVLTGTEPPQVASPEQLRAALGAAPALAGRQELVDHIMAMLDRDPSRRPAHLANWVAQLRSSSLIAPPEHLPPPAPARHPDRSQAPTEPGPSRAPSSRDTPGAAVTEAAGRIDTAPEPVLPPARRRANRVLVVIAGVAVVLAGGGAALAMRGGGGTTPTTVGTTSTTGSTTTTTGPNGGGGGTTLGPPPWASAPITSGAARTVGIAEWHKAGRETLTRLLLPADVGLSPSARPRAANFGGASLGQWAVAWDDPGRRGIDAGSGGFCDTCGRGTVLIATQVNYPLRAGAFTLTWSDGSVAREYPEDGVRATGEVVKGAGWKALLTIPGQTDPYLVLTYGDRSQLDALLNQLRFVAGAP